LEQVITLLLGFRHVCDLHYYVCSCYLDVSCLLFERIIGLDYTVERLAEKGRWFASLGIENTSVAFLATLVTNEAMVG
jgi:hypothetical protein